MIYAMLENEFDSLKGDPLYEKRVWIIFSNNTYAYLLTFSEQAGLWTDYKKSNGFFKYI